MCEVVPSTLGLALSVLKRLRGIQFSTKKICQVFDPFLRSAPHSKTLAQMCTIITLLDKLELQKHLNACLRKVVTRTLVRFLNLRCPAVSDHSVVAMVRSASLSISHSTPLAKSCACHVVITLSLLVGSCLIIRSFF